MRDVLRSLIIKCQCTIICCMPMKCHRMPFLACQSTAYVTIITKRISISIENQ